MTRRLWLGLVFWALALAAEFSDVRLPFVESIDRFFYDMRLRWHPVRPTNRIVIVDIDERSLREHGPWPWSRADLARLTEAIVGQGGARVLAFDMVLSESPAEPDVSLAAAFKDRPVVLGYYFSAELGAMSTGALPAPVAPSMQLGATEADFIPWNSYGGNAPFLQSAARGAGFFNVVHDRDGVVRSVPLLAEYRGHLYESLPLAALRAYWGPNSVRMRGPPGPGLRLEIGLSGRVVSVPLSESASLLVPFQGWRGSGHSRFRSISATDLLRGRIDPRFFKDRMVLVGSSAPRLGDLRVTPVGDAFPGVEIHASLIAGILEGHVRIVPPYGRALGLGLMGVVGLLTALGMARLGGGGIAVAAALGVVAVLAVYGVAYSAGGVVLPCAAGLMVVLILAGMNLALITAQEQRERRAMLGLFGQYVAPQLVARMARDPHDAPLEGQNKTLTILFADIRGFTRMAEHMEPHQLRDYLNRFLTAMTEVIHQYHGTVDKYIGDAVMAFWGAPVDDPEHADHAVTAALAMQFEIARLNREFSSLGWPELVVGIGINTGLVRVGDMGSRLRRAYTVIGDAVNLAARFESLTKHFDVPILLGEATCQAVRTVRLAYVGQAEVPGRSEPVVVWQPVTVPKPALPRAEMPAPEAASTPSREPLPRESVQ